MPLLLVTCVIWTATAEPGTSPEDEFIRVADDQWTFVTRNSKTRFVPFGANFVLNDKKYLNLFDPKVYDAPRYERALTELESLGFNLVKVFLPIAQVLPDPQVPGETRIAPGYLENLEAFLAMARRHHIRVIVSLASWGGNSIRWWHEGGEYFGRRPWRTENGVDSLGVLARFWTVLGTRLKNNPTVFSYTPAVEWTLPAGNLTWTPPNKQYGRLDTPAGRFYWRAFLRAGYEGDITALNRRYGTDYGRFNDVPLVDYTYDLQARRYTDPESKILDYQNFREWASWRYLQPQIAAIRAADPHHLVTLSNHSRRAIGLWPGAARYFAGFSVPEQSELVDYFSSHDNVSQSKLRPGQDLSYVVRAAILRTRFCNARVRKPVIIEEFTFACSDPQKVAEAQAAMVLGTVGHASGWLNWYLQYPREPNSADMGREDRSAILNDNFTPTPWGLRARDLIRQLKSMDLSRKPPETILDVDRKKSLVPRSMGWLPMICESWDRHAQPMDFRWPRNKWITLPVSAKPFPDE